MTEHDATTRDTWTARDYPVLVAAANRFEANEGAEFDDYELRVPGLDPSQIAVALLALIPDYVEGYAVRLGNGEVSTVTVHRLTSEGRREAGLWPKKADHLASLIAALEAAAERAEDAEERSTLQSIGDGLKAAPGSVLSGIVTAWLASQGGV